MAIALLFLVTLLVAYANGANDNFKGVATLFGSDVTSYSGAIALGTIATLAGSLCSVFLAEALVQTFSGKGLVPDAVALSPLFVLAVASAAAATIMLATRKGFPVSTTHALVGALVGAGFIASGTGLNLRALGSTFFAPLIVSPLIAFALAALLYRVTQSVLARKELDAQSCVCLGSMQWVPAVPSELPLGARSFALAAPSAVGLQVAVGSAQACARRYSGSLLGVRLQSVFNGLHYLSVAAVSFARGLNDTPKIIALLLVAHALDIRFGMVAGALAMASGGILNAQRVAQTMSKRITRMDETQALAANLITAALVIFASRLGMPVSTTHVSVGAIGGVGLARASVDRSVLGAILLSWLLTLPIAAFFGAAIYVIGHFIP
ncbi:MAG TPA: anion permease [Casimicrobiaceae bacterium]|jgi:PiT family inorganic phosphate transporter|nr:anion permease [Casimicrobiaceae bacterium]